MSETLNRDHRKKVQEGGNVREVLRTSRKPLAGRQRNTQPLHNNIHRIKLKDVEGRGKGEETEKGGKKGDHLMKVRAKK